MVSNVFLTKASWLLSFCMLTSLLCGRWGKNLQKSDSKVRSPAVFSSWISPGPCQSFEKDFFSEHDIPLHFGHRMFHQNEPAFFFLEQTSKNLSKFVKEPILYLGVETPDSCVRVIYASSFLLSKHPSICVFHKGKHCSTWKCRYKKHQLNLLDRQVLSANEAYW